MLTDGAYNVENMVFFAILLQIPTKMLHCNDFYNDCNIYYM